VYSVDRLQIPLLVGVATNDEDVNIEESMQLVDALRARKPQLADTVIFDNPPGGHLFDRRVDRSTWQPENTAEQRESWSRVWRFLGTNLERPEPANEAASEAVSLPRHVDRVH
jgi:dipeptidyl aminopeptidase/acylaminoacyl peptidase